MIAASHCPSCPNFIWERLLLLAKFHFALLRPSNKVAQTIAFPNEIWERGIRLLLGYVVLALALVLPIRAMDIDSFKSQQRAWEDQGHLTRGDLLFFFDRISLTDHGWEFKLSPNVRGMLWRMRKEKLDVTGACDSGQVLNLPPAASLEIKQKGLVLFFEPRGLASFWVRLSMETTLRDSVDHEEREALLASHGAGFGLMYAED